MSAYINKFHMIEPGDKVILGLSGGADSVCLLLVLLALQEKIPFAIEAVHVNHCMRDSAKGDELFVRTLCKEKEVPLHVYVVDVCERAQREGLTSEEAGRNVRYECFEEVRQKTGANKIAVAHHKNDRAETILFQMSRGSGVAGMIGIKPVRDRVIRPLLCLERTDIERFLTENGQAYVTDETNKSSEYSRNRVRNEVLPVLEEVCPGAVSHIAAAGETMQEVSDFLQEQILGAMRNCADVTRCSEGVVKLSCTEFSKLHTYLQSEIIRECIFLLANSKKDILRLHTDAVFGLLQLQVGRRIELPYGIEVQKSYETLVFSKKKMPEEPADFCVEVTEQELEHGISVPLPDGKQMSLHTFAYDSRGDIPTKTYTKWLNYDKIKGTVTIRTPKNGDFFYFNNKNKKYVKDYMVNEKIPQAERGCSIIVADGDHMLYFVGRRISNGVLIDKTTRKILEITVTGG